MLVAWGAQACVGLSLLLGWVRQGRPRGAALVLSHVGLAVVSLAMWVALVATGDTVWGWLAFGILSVANGFGDALMVRRFVRTSHTSRGMLRDYGGAIAAVVRGRLGRRVGFHAVFSGVVYFGSLGVCVALS